MPPGTPGPFFNLICNMNLLLIDDFYRVLGLQIRFNPCPGMPAQPSQRFLISMTNCRPRFPAPAAALDCIRDRDIGEAVAVAVHGTTLLPDVKYNLQSSSFSNVAPKSI